MSGRWGIWRLRLGVVCLSLSLSACAPTGAEGIKRPQGEAALSGERLVLGIDAKASGWTDKGFQLDLASGFDRQGEEKLQTTNVFVEWPLQLPPINTWRRIDSSSDSFQAADLAFGLDWGPSETYGEPFRVVALRYRYPNGVKPVPPPPSKSAIRWRFEKDDVGNDGWYSWIAEIYLPPWQTSVGKVPLRQNVTSVDPPVISIEGDLEDHGFVQRSVIALSNALNRPYLPVGDFGFAPFGVNNSLYFGHTFWDMDVWVLPSMLFLQPDAVRQMNKYRLDRAAQAENNGAEFFKKPNSGMMFPWESSVTGKETVRASSVKEHHISGSVLWGLNLSDKAGISRTNYLVYVLRKVGKFYEKRSVAGPDGREIKDVMSPDENHIGDNDLYTNLLAQWAMNGGKWEGPTKFKLPKDVKSFLTYDNDRERGYKQAAAVLSIFPLQYPPAEKQARTMMERFEGKVSKNGPAMSDAIHATIWARLGEKEKAYDAWKRAWEPFVKGPQMMFSEKRSSERTYFYTGAAGCLNTVLYGFAGFRLDEKPLEGAVWKKQLQSGWWLSCKPCLPPKWKSLKINPMIIDGQKYSVEIDPEKVRIEPR